MPPRSPDTDAKGAAEYGREAIAHFSEAARFGARALAERKREKSAEKGASRLKEELPSGEGGSKESGGGGLKEHLPSAKGGGSEIGELADSVLAKFGKSGKLASKIGVGHRIVERLLPAGDGEGTEADSDEGEEDAGGQEEAAGAAAEADDDHLFDESAPMPIQESIDVAVPVAAIFDLCTRFEELPRFSDRIEAVEIEDDTHLALEAKIGRRRQVLALEITGEEPEERIDWECEEGVEHAGVVSFHPLAPRLTRLELTVEPRSEGTVERLLRLAGLPERAIRQELRRFKAYAELWDEANDYKSADFKDPASEPEDAEPEDEDDELEDEEPDEEPVEDEVPEEDEEGEEPLEDEELEPAGSS